MQRNIALLSDSDAARPLAGTAAAWWLGQHGFVLKLGHTVVYVDAFLSALPGRTVPPLLSPDHITNADLVLGSHDHADHIDRAAWPAIAQASPGCRFIVPDLVRDSVVNDLELPAERVLGLNAGQTLDLGDCRITGVAAAHEFLDCDAATGRYPYLGFVIEGNGCTLYHAGDCCLYEGLVATLKRWRFDAVFLPINGRDAKRLAAGCIGNMTYQEAADLAGALQPRLTIPTHFEMFDMNSVDPALFLDYMRVKYPHLQILRPEHGRRFGIGGRGGEPDDECTRPSQPVRLTTGIQSLRQRPFAGFGLQCDAYLYDAINAAAGVKEQDYALIETRLRAIRPSLARMFCHVGWFNPEHDAATYRWDLPGYGNMLRLLRVLQEIGANVNLVLFSPYRGQTMDTHRASVRAMADLLLHLRDVEGITAVRWLTIFNEPETVFPHDSPLMRRIFGPAHVDGSARWDDLVELWQLAQQRLEAIGLHPHVKLAVPDCVYGSPVRYERMRLAADTFRETGVDFAVHVYSPEDQGDQPQTAEQRRDWGYPGMAREAADFRAMVGPDRRLILWEYNLEGLGGRTPWFPGVNRQGVAVMETPEAGIQILEKTILAINHGYDGACLWCLTDMLYCESPAMMMQVGLWHFKHALWYPRPHYYYFAPLCQLFRPGMTLVSLDGVEAPLLAMAARQGEEMVAVIINRGATAQRLCIRNWTGHAQRLRVHPDGIPANDGNLPLDDWRLCCPAQDGALHMELLPREATFLRTASNLTPDTGDPTC